MHARSVNVYDATRLSANLLNLSPSAERFFFYISRGENSMKKR